MKPAVIIPIIALGIGIPAAIGYYIGQKKSDQQKDDTPKVQAKQKPEIEHSAPPQPENMNDPETEKPGTPKEQTPKTAVISPESLSKDKNVPASLKNPQGDLTLIAVIETVSGNAKLTRSIQLVTAQRQQLAKLSQQFGKTPETSVQQRELIAGQINQTRKTLEQNLVYMQKNYGYSLKNNYAYIPHKATLNLVTKVDGKPKSKLVYDFENAESYQEFQKKREAYLRLKIEQARAAQKAAAEEAKTKPSSTADKKLPKLEPTEEMKKASDELIGLYNYDPDKNYRIDIAKAALYARAAR